MMTAILYFQICAWKYDIRTKLVSQWSSFFRFNFLSGSIFCPWNFSADQVKSSQVK